MYVSDLSVLCVNFNIKLDELPQAFLQGLREAHVQLSIHFAIRVLYV